MKTLSTENKVLQIAENNNGIVTTKMCKKHGIANIYLTRLVQKGQLEKQHRGIYATSWGLADQMFVLQNTYPELVFCLETALAVHDLVDTLTTVYEVVIPKGHRINNKYNNVISYQKTKTNYNLGLITIENSIGNKIRCYDMERTICDIIINQEKVTNENFFKAIHTYNKHTNKNTDKLMQYAKKLKIEKEVNLIMKVING